MAGIRETDFSEVEVTKLGIRIGTAKKADVLTCVGKLEEEMNCKTMTKKCGAKILKTRTKGTGDGTAKVSVYMPQDTLADLHGMTRTELKDGVIAYGTNSLHAEVCITAEVLDEDGNKKFKAYPKCTIQTALSRSVDNDSEDISMLELEFAIMPDEHGEGLYEAIADDLKDATVKQKWMEEFSRSLVTTEAA